MSHKQTYRVITSRKQEGSLAATSDVSEDFAKRWQAWFYAASRLNDHSVFEVTIKKNNDAFPANDQI